MNLWNRLKGIFSRRGSGEASEGRGGFFSGMRERVEERRRDREYRRSQRRMERMERRQRKEEQRQKQQRMNEEQEAKRQAEEEERRRDEKARQTFKERWGFNDDEYGRFMQFINSIPREYIEQLGSDTLVEFFRTGQTYNLSHEEIANVVKQTMETTEGVYAEDIINDLYTNLEGYAQNVKASGGNI